MRIVAISDNHGYSLNQIDNKLGLPDGDILVHAGDFTDRGEIAYISRFVESVKDYDYDEVIVIAGNHDFCFQNDLQYRAEELIEEECIYLRNDSVTVDGVKFHGTPWSCKFGNWAFMGGIDKLSRQYERIDDDTDVIISHTPPHDILDEVKYTRPDETPHVGSKALKKRIESVEPELVVCGHIHEAYGDSEVDGIKYINASVCNLDYDLVNDPVVVEV